MVLKAIIESKHNPDVFMRLSCVPQFKCRNNLKMLLEENNVLFEYMTIDGVSITLLRNAMVYENHSPAGRQQPNVRKLPAESEKAAIHVPFFAELSSRHVFEDPQRLRSGSAATTEQASIHP